MARQISSANDRSDFDADAWITKWHSERDRYRSFLLVSVNEPLRPNDGVSVYVFPHLDARDMHGCFLDRRYHETGYEVGRCLLNERLTAHTAARLNTILSIIRQLHGLDFQQGLAFLVQYAIFVIDSFRARNGQESMLFGPTYGQFELDTEEGRNRFLEFENQPIWSVESILKFWDHHGGGLVATAYKSPDGTPGTPNYITIPPTWLPLAKLKELHGEKAESWTVAVAVELQDMTLVESLLHAYRTHRQLGMPFPSKELRSVDETNEQIFRKEGDFWTISYKGQTIHLKNSKGLQYLALLLQHPGREWRAIDILRYFVEPSVDPIAQVYSKMPQGQLEEEHLTLSELGDAGAMVDARAEHQYKCRLHELQAELAEAERFNDLERASQARGEIDFITQQLKAASGLGGRERRIGSSAERARTSVTKAINTALKKIGMACPVLGYHLSKSISTGLFCSYTPDPDDPICWTS
jgi:hypothetical protein